MASLSHWSGELAFIHPAAATKLFSTDYLFSISQNFKYSDHTASLRISHPVGPWVWPHAHHVQLLQGAVLCIMGGEE